MVRAEEPIAVVNRTTALALPKSNSKKQAHFSSSSLCMKPLTVSVTLKPWNSQSLACLPQCDVEAGEGLFFGCGGLVVGLDAMGETAESDVVRFGSGGVCVELVEMFVGFGSEAGGEGRPLGDLDLDRECWWKMESPVADRESDLPWKGNGNE